jgi:hypothetical protein
VKGRGQEEGNGGGWHSLRAFNDNSSPTDRNGRWQRPVTAGLIPAISKFARKVAQGRILSAKQANSGSASLCGDSMASFFGPAPLAGYSAHRGPLSTFKEKLPNARLRRREADIGEQRLSVAGEIAIWLPDLEIYSQ